MAPSPHISLSLVLRSVLLVCYASGLVFGGGLHLHVSISHDHDSAPPHIHSLLAHMHETAIPSYPGHNNETISPRDTHHNHPVPSLEPIAVPASTAGPKHVIQNTVTNPTEAIRHSFPSLSISLLHVLPRETSPPLLARTDLPDSGRSPPASS